RPLHWGSSSPKLPRDIRADVQAAIAGLVLDAPDPAPEESRVVPLEAVIEPTEQRLAFGDVEGDPPPVPGGVRHAAEDAEGPVRPEPLGVPETQPLDHLTGGVAAGLVHVRAGVPPPRAHPDAP